MKSNYDKYDVWVYRKYYLRPSAYFWGLVFPCNGNRGAALATGIGQTITLAIYLVIYFVRPIRIHISRQFLTFDKNSFQTVFCWYTRNFKYGFAICFNFSAKFHSVLIFRGIYFSFRNLL